MSIHTVERILYEIASKPERAAAFKLDPGAFLNAYPLACGEADMILKMDVAEMQRRGLNPMLAMRAFTTLEGRDRFPDYLRRLREE